MPTILFTCSLSSESEEHKSEKYNTSPVFELLFALEDSFISKTAWKVEDIPTEI